MAYWLVKSEPYVYSFDMLVKDKKTNWDGVRNYSARNNLKEMQKGDMVFFYHSNEGMAIVGIASVTKTAFPDNTTDVPGWVAVEIKPEKKLKTPVPLSVIKKDQRLSNMDLVRISQLSVQKVRPAEWKIILKIAGEI